MRATWKYEYTRAFQTGPVLGIRTLVMSILIASTDMKALHFDTPS